MALLVLVYSILGTGDSQHNPSSSRVAISVSWVKDRGPGELLRVYTIALRHGTEFLLNAYLSPSVESLMCLHNSSSLPDPFPPLFISFFMFGGGRQLCGHSAPWSCAVCSRVHCPQMPLSLLSLSPCCSCGNFFIFQWRTFPFIP